MWPVAEFAPNSAMSRCTWFSHWPASKAHIVYARTPLRGWFPACQAGFGFLETLRSAINWAACRPSEGVVRNEVRNSEGGDALGAKEEAT